MNENIDNTSPSKPSAYLDFYRGWFATLPDENGEPTVNLSNGYFPTSRAALESARARRTLN